MNKRMRKKKRLEREVDSLSVELNRQRRDFKDIQRYFGNTTSELRQEIGARAEQVIRLGEELGRSRSYYDKVLARVTLLEESQVALVRENTMLKDRLATFEKINEDNVVVANDKFTSLEKECQEMRKELNKFYLQKKPWWKR